MTDFIKNPLQSSLNELAINRARQQIAQTGMTLPVRVTAVNGSLVTVEFEVDSSPFQLPKITVPKAESPYFRMPTQIGDMGIVIPADVAIGNISGVSTTLPTLRSNGNLGSLVFLPVSNKSKPPQNPNAAEITEPSGTASISVDETGITFKVGGKVWTLTAIGLTLSTGVIMETHVHTSTTPGDPTSPPLP